MSQTLINSILEKINTHGINALSYDERIFLNQNSSNTIDPNLENWLTCKDEVTFDSSSKKLLYNEFEEGEDIFENPKKLQRIISNLLNIKPFTNNSDWGGALVWSLKAGNNFTGYFIYLCDNELVLLYRIINEGKVYVDTTLLEVIDVVTLNKLFLKVKGYESINDCQ